MGFDEIGCLCFACKGSGAHRGKRIEDQPSKVDVVLELIISPLVFALIFGDARMMPAAPTPLPSPTFTVKRVYVDHPVRSTFIDSVCPADAIGAIRLNAAGDETEMTGSLVNLETSERNGILTARFWRPSPRAESVVEMNLRKNTAYATVGSVRKINSAWCAFSRHQ